MQETINQRSIVFLLSSIGLITLPHVLHVPAPIFAFFSVLLIWRFIGVWHPEYLPNQLLVFLLLLCGISLLVTMHQGVFGRDAGTTVFVIALGLKLLEIKTQRDVYLIVYLAFIVAASQLLYIQNILMAGYILLVCISLLATLIFINSASQSNIASLKTAGNILMQAIPLMVIMFIFFPRVEAPRWSFLDNDNQATSGLSDTLEPGSISQLGLSGELVFRAKFTGDLPPNAERYWRGPVFSFTDGKKWTQTKNTHFKRYLDKTQFMGKAYQYLLLMEPQSKNWVFALDMPETYHWPLHENGNRQLISSEPAGKRAEYSITSYAQYNTGYITKTELSDNLQLPNRVEGRIDDLVGQLGGFDTSPGTFINKVFAHFRNEDFYYTLMPPLLDEKPIETFLFDTREGFCGHYATAFVYLMRVAGIPARIVGGYQGGAYNETGGFIEVRQANAHAWAEVWLQDKGWVRYDPTTAIAPERIEQDVNIEQQIANNAVSFAPIQLDSQTLALLKQARSLWSSADYNWHRWIINYDRRQQFSFLSSFGIDTLKSMLYWLVGLVALVTIFLAAYLFRKQTLVLEKSQIYYARACQKLAKTGLIKQDCEGANDFSQRVREQQPDIAESFAHITQLYVQIRYARQFDDSLLEQLGASAAAFRVSKS
ncbi:transglutaminase TgpA family protein [Methyloprofundus sp.]|uniref:transglutaminase TgpA family protein n=1 Tax=Methyloprofundus sp. TaxID=2020875 RepID=UPI003D0A59E6